MTPEEKINQIEEILTAFDDEENGMIEDDEHFIKLIKKTITGEIVNLEPDVEPECSESTEDDEIECEYVVKHGSWWCTTHNCYA